MQPQKIENTNVLPGPLLETHNHPYPMQDSVFTPAPEDRCQVSQLLHSTQDPSIQQLLCEHGLPTPINPEQRFTIASTSPGSYDLCLIETEDEISAKTAASHALLYACWLCDLELVQWLVQDLKALIDTDTLIDERNALEWAIGEVKDMDFDQEAYADRLNSALDVCRFLIGCFGSEINANSPSGCILAACTYDIICDHADIVAHLVRTYAAELIHAAGIYGIFELLLDNNYEEEALAYFEQHRVRVAGDLGRAFKNILMPSASKGSANMFKLMLDRLGSQVPVLSINYLFMNLCCYYCSTKESHQNEDRAKVEAALGAPCVDQDGVQGTWATKLTEDTISKCLVGCQKVAVRSIVQSCVDQIKGQNISLALAACCPQDLDLFDTVFDLNQNQIQSDPQLLRHAAFECVYFRDIEALEHTLSKCGSLIYSMVLELWAMIGDIGAVKMIIETITDINTVAAVLPTVLQRACYEGDTEMAELIINFAGISIGEEGYKQAFRYACYGARSETIQTLATEHRSYFDYRSNDEYGFALARIPQTIINLLNSIYDTTLEYIPGRDYVNPPCFQSSVQYDSVIVEYYLPQSNKRNVIRKVQPPASKNRATCK